MLEKFQKTAATVFEISPNIRAKYCPFTADIEIAVEGEIVFELINGRVETCKLVKFWFDELTAF